MSRREIDSPYAWFRLAVSLLLSTIGGVGMWSVVVALPAVQEGFGVARGGASLPFTLTMIGFGVGGVIMGKVSDRVGIIAPVVFGALSLGVGYILASLAPTLILFALAYGLFIGIGTSATFAPLIADISHWFEKRRGIAVALCASGNYVGGTFWPPVIEHFISTAGWRATHLGVGIFCLATMVPIALLLRSPAPVRQAGAAAPVTQKLGTLGLSPRTLQGLLAVAGVACCVAMSMPQVHIVAYCGDLGYGVAVGAQMLSLMLGFGIVSRIASGLLADRIGGMWTLFIGSVAQMTALSLYMLTDALVPLYVISAMFGLFQGGLVPSYALVIRECFPASEAGSRVGIVMMATLLGMALGGWMSGVIYDMTGSYQAAFANGVAWNALNAVIAVFLLLRRGRMERAGSVAPAVA
ncbi:MAG: MFS transporter [Acetobacteraceae bacterium]